MLADKLRAQIRADGPMPFEEYMAACLYDEEFGFFATGPLRSVKSGDFLTSPEVSPWLGRMLARFVAREEERTGADPFRVVEVGAGSGSLLKPLMETLLDVPPAEGRGEAERSDAGGPSYAFHAIEASPAARDALADLLGPANVYTSLDDLPDHFDGVIIVNELLDNLPVALAIRSGDGWVERWVGATDDRFGFVTAPARPDVAAWCDAYAGTVPEGGMVEVQLAATEWMRTALQHIDQGTVVVIDYGGTAEELEPRRTQGTLRTYRSHHLGPDPLLEPGATDVTVDVNFTAMLAAAESAGATAELHRQDDFLANLGLRETIRDLRHRERDLARSGETMERLIVRSEATDAETLLHPRGLGDFRVMVARKQ
ncbi:MAG: SAM-dependent methyltransferase [Actinomycetota bacterium]|nr:SAM-dependent methyltransferase [Actinomycetota bacterium]